jgi:SAM-dependent methyltransferase
MDAEHWDRRYAGRDLVWGHEPNPWVAEHTADLPPGRLLDVACGEGRNTLWLASRGWRATGVDFSAIALDRAAELAAAASLEGSVEWVRSDVLTFVPEPGAYDLVLLSYLQLPPDQRRSVVRAVATGLARSGLLMVVAHDSTNLTDGVGGPQYPRVLYTAQDVVADLAPVPGLTVLRAEAVRRAVDTDTGPRDAIDALLIARRD